MTTTSTIPDAPLVLYTNTVQPEWIDYNGHMNEGYYAVAFCHATDALLDYLDLGADYYTRTQCTIYTVESHISYLRELKLGEPLRFATQLLGYDAKRLHVFHHLYHAEEGFLAATFEVMMLHVDQRVVKTAAMPAEVLGRLEAVLAAHAELGRPAQAGRSIGIRRKK